MIAVKGPWPATPLAALENSVFIHPSLEMHIYPSLFRLMEENRELYDVAWWVRSQDESTKHSNRKNQTRHAWSNISSPRFIHR
jgi:hypothetical protein